MLVRETKPGYLTTEFWLLIVANVLINLGAIDVGDAKIKGLITLATIIGYQLSRGLAKSGVPAEQVQRIPLDDPSDAERH